MGCPKDWYPFHDRCMRFELGTKDWMAARADCRGKNGDLVTVRNLLELDEIKNFGTNSWIGLNSITEPDRPRIFRWSNGVPLTFTPWDVESASANVTGTTDVNCGALTNKVEYDILYLSS